MYGECFLRKTNWFTIKILFSSKKSIKGEYINFSKTFDNMHEIETGL